MSGLYFRVAMGIGDKPCKKYKEFQDQGFLYLRNFIYFHSLILRKRSTIVCYHITTIACYHSNY